MSASQRRKVFIIGDVHGCFDELLLLIKKSGYQKNKHRLIVLGDLINKGPHSFEVLKWVKSNRFVEPIIGNHELKFIKAIENQKDLHPFFKELKTRMNEQLFNYISWMKSWPVYIEEENFLAVHGGIIPGEHPSSSKAELLVNIRYWDGTGKNMQDPSCPAWHDLYNGSKLVIYAHWAQQGLHIKNNSIGLDTGCVYGGKLTGIWLPEKELVQVPSSREKKYAQEKNDES